MRQTPPTSTLFPYTTLFRSDLDLRDPVYLLNSSVRDFYTTLAHFLEWTQKTGGSPAELARLGDALRRQDCIPRDRKSTRLNSSHSSISYAVFCLKKKKNKTI